MDLIDQNVAENFARFEKNHDPTLVHAALETIEAAERNVPIDDKAARRLALSRRLNFFAALARNIDPEWDASDLPVQGVQPPALKQDVVPSSGEVDPAKIPDPEIRARYVPALKVNKDENQRYFVQTQLRQIEERTTRFVERLLIDRYTNSPADRAELEDLLAGSPLSDVRKEQLRRLFPGPRD